MIRAQVSNIMIDLETMGVRPTSAIVSIGAVHFDEANIIDKFHIAVNLQSCYEVGMTFDQSTVDWWAKQSAEASSSWQNDQAKPIVEALTEFSRWMGQTATKPIAPWGNGSDFDNVLMVAAYNAVGADPPWKFYNHRCFRTLKSLFPVADMPRQGVHHNALDDALHQVHTLHRIVNVYGVKL